MRVQGPVEGLGRLEVRQMPHAFQRRETVEIVRQSIVFHQSSVFRLEQFNDGEITVIDQFGSMEHFSAVLLVALTLVFNDLFWDAQSNVTVVASPIALIWRLFGATPRTSETRRDALRRSRRALRSALSSR